MFYIMRNPFLERNKYEKANIIIHMQDNLLNKLFMLNVLFI